MRRAQKWGRAACLHDHGCLGKLSESEEEVLTGVALLARHLSGVVGDGDLEGGLCQIDCDESMVRHGWAPSFAYSKRLWH